MTHVLILNANEDIGTRILFSVILGRQGFQVTVEAFDPERYIDIVAQHQPDCVLVLGTLSQPEYIALLKNYAVMLFSYGFTTQLQTFIENLNTHKDLRSFTTLDYPVNHTRLAEIVQEWLDLEKRPLSIISVNKPHVLILYTEGTYHGTQIHLKNLLEYKNISVTTELLIPETCADLIELQQPAVVLAIIREELPADAIMSILHRSPVILCIQWQTAEKVSALDDLNGQLALRTDLKSLAHYELTFYPLQYQIVNHVLDVIEGSSGV
ncbi:MAG: hypothetical protein RLP44_14520 [Aggregatilineales bacterium]